jgi:DNA-binding transcriptional ArsR family regulator
VAASLTEVVSHQVRLRIVQQLGGREQTTAELARALSDISQATLYRHVAALIDAEVVTVVGLRQIRGTVERTLALGARMAHVDSVELQAMDLADLRLAFLTFLAELARGFDEYAAADTPELRGHLGFGATALHVSLDDLAEIQRRLGELLAPYLQEREGVQRVMLGTLLLPQADAGSPVDIRPQAPGLTD